VSGITNLSAVAISEAVVSLYPALTTGEADYTRPIWLGAAAQAGRFGEEIAVRRRQATGLALPRYLPGASSLRISLDRVWTRHETAADWRPGRQACVLELTWRDALSGRWSRHRFYGVQAVSGEWTNDGYYAFGVGQSFVAAAMVSLGGTGLLPEQAGLLDVHWRDGDTHTHLFRYGTATGVYTEVFPGTAEVLGVELDGASGAVMVGGEDWLGLGDGGIMAASLSTDQSGRPERRLEYRIGDRLAGSLHRGGLIVPATSQVAGPLALPTDGFAFRDGATVRATLRADRLRYLSFTTL
jgi:hypothetical protein